MTDHSPVTTEAKSSTSVVPIRIPDEHLATGTARLSDVDEWGRSERFRSLARSVYEPIYSKWFRVEWEGMEKIPTAVAHCSWATTPGPFLRTHR